LQAVFFAQKKMASRPDILTQPTPTVFDGFEPTENHILFSHPSVPLTSDPMSAADVQAESAAANPVLPLFTRAHLSRSFKRGPSRQMHFFCNTAVQESNIPQSIATQLGLTPLPADSKTVTGYLSLSKRSPRKRLEFVVFPDSDASTTAGKDIVLNLGARNLKRMRATIDVRRGSCPGSRVRKDRKKTEEAAVAPPQPVVSTS
jgi:hypothetical protein